MRMALAAALLVAAPAVTAVGAADAAQSTDALQVSLEIADGSAYQKNDLRVRMIFKNTAEPVIRIPAAAFERGAFSIVDSEGRAPRRMSETGAAAGKDLVVDGYGTEERIVDLTAWYPKLTAKRQGWTLGWTHGDFNAGPFPIRVIRPHDPRKDRYAIVETSLGDMRWELLTDIAPDHVKRFVDLVREGFYDGLNIYKVLPGVEAEGGDPNRDGTGGWGRLMFPEIDPDLPMRPGLIGAVRRETSMTSDKLFFITLATSPHMAGKHTFYARVVDGLDVVGAINRAENYGNTGLKNMYMLVHPVEIHRIRIR